MTAFRASRAPRATTRRVVSYLTGMLGILALALSLAGGAPPAGAQQNQDNILRIAAVVNGDVISMWDLQNRLRLVALSSGLQIDQETQNRLLPQVMRSMIDEKLQLQAAEEANIRVTERDLDGAMSNVAGRNNMSTDQMREFMRQRGIDLTTLRNQVEAQVAWSKYVGRRLARDVRIGEDEIDEELARLRDVADEPQRRVYEIFLAIDNPDREDEVRQNAERLVNQVRGGADFGSLARSFSQSATAANNGDLGWVAAGQLEPELDSTLQQLEPGTISKPIRTVAGYYILYVTDKRIEGLDPNDAEIDLAQMTVRAPPQGEPEAREAVRRELAAGVGDLAGCEGLSDWADRRDDANIARAQKVRLGDLPDGVRQAIAPLQPGQSTQPIERGRNYVVVSVCGRKDPAVNLPSRDEVQQRLRNQRLDLRARRELRDLRRTAFIDVRL